MSALSYGVPMAVTLKQLAEVLGLDVSTVSYALSGKGTINEETRRRVRELADEMGYVPNRLARRLRTQTANAIGLVVPDALAYGPLIQQVFRQAGKGGLEVSVAFTEFDADLEHRPILSLMELQVDGIILRSTFPRLVDCPGGHALRRLAAGHMPAVAYGFPIEGSPIPAVTLPIARQAEMILTHLIERGHRRFAALLGWPFAQAQRLRVQGYLKALADAGLGEDALGVLTVEAKAEAEEIEKPGSHYHRFIWRLFGGRPPRMGRGLFRRLRELYPMPTAVVCHHESTALGVIAEATDHGLRVPEDLAVAATDIGLAGALSPVDITTADAVAADTAPVALAMLRQAMAGSMSPGETRTVEPVMRVAGSTVGSGPDEIVAEIAGRVRRFETAAEALEASRPSKPGDIPSPSVEM